MESLQKCYPKQ